MAAWVKSGRPDSNRHRELGRLLCDRYTTPARDAAILRVARRSYAGAVLARVGYGLVSGGSPGAMAVPQEELRSLVERLAGEPDRWRALVRHDPGRRTYE